MASERYVALGLARVRAEWFSDVSRWATSGSLAMDFVKTVSVDEVRVRLDTGRAFSALLVDGGVPGVDRDLLAFARERGCAPIIVDDTNSRDWAAIGAAAVLPPGFGPTELEATLADHATPIGRPDELPGRVADIDVAPAPFRAPIVGVTGPGGTGRSVMAMALAQGFAADPSHTDTVLLADLALHADQAMLHDARDVIPGVLELVEAHRGGVLSAEEARGLTFDIVARRYRLLLGLRQHRDWTALRPRAVRAAIDRLRESFTLVIADLDDDLEDETSTGSADVEDRNLLARTTIAQADVVVVVGAPGPKGAHSLLRVVRDCLAAGVGAERIVPVVNRSPRSRAARTAIVRTVTDLLAASNPGQPVLGPIFVPERRQLDDAVHDGALLPDAVVSPVATAVAARLDAVQEPNLRAPADEPVPVPVGSLGSWNEDEVAG